MAERARKYADLRTGKRRKRFERLVAEFDEIRSLITIHNGNFYTYIVSHFADVISVYKLDESEMVDISNGLYLMLKKQSRVLAKERLLMDFEQDHADEID
jgi:hypothetical protein